MLLVEQRLLPVRNRSTLRNLRSISPVQFLQCNTVSLYTPPFIKSFDIQSLMSARRKVLLNATAVAERITSATHGRIVEKCRTLRC